jgi:hypothetical protein
MKQVPANLNAKDAVAQADGFTEIRDERGLTIGYVVSLGFGLQLQEERKAFYKYLDSLFPKEEMERSRSNPKRYSMADVLKVVEAR